MSRLSGVLQPRSGPTPSVASMPQSGDNPSIAELLAAARSTETLRELSLVTAATESLANRAAQSQVSDLQQLLLAQQQQQAAGAAGASDAVTPLMDLLRRSKQQYDPHEGPSLPPR